MLITAEQEIFVKALSESDRVFCPDMHLIPLFFPLFLPESEKKMNARKGSETEYLF